VYQVIINPNMMMTPVNEGAGTPKLELLHNTYPAWALSFGQAVTFTWGRPLTVPYNTMMPLKLRLYWSAYPYHKEGYITWQVNWRWFQAMEPQAEHFNQLSQLSMFTHLFPAKPYPGHTVSAHSEDATEPVLHVTPSYELILPESEDEGIGIPVGDYLIVQIRLDNIQGSLDLGYLLLAELRWEKAE
jgi:hypothetical protein